NTVVEINVVGQVVHARPFDRLAGPEALAHGLQKRAVGEELRVAIHTGRCRRHSGEGRGLDRRVAIPAIKTVVARVVLVRELHGLPARDESPRVVWRALDFGERPGDAGENEDCAEYTHPGNGVRAAMKNLGHYRSGLSVRFSRLGRLHSRPFPDGLDAS